MESKLMSCLLILLVVFSGGILARRSKRPNVVIMFADDVGYGDLQVYGHPTSSTPNLNRMAASGKVFTQFYAAAPICSPSRAALLTGRYHMRSGIYPGVFNVTSSGGLPHREVTIAEMLKSRGYYTAMVGKWHLGVGRDGQYLPPSQGFDEFLGLPASHSHCPCTICFSPNRTCLSGCKHNFSPCPMYNGTTIIEQPVDLLTLDEKYATQARSVIRRSAENGKPFFLYYSHQHTHDPPYADWRHTGSTARGDFGDALAALDWEVGQVMEELEANNLLNDTFVFFTADNGPSLSKRWGGSVGLLKCGKATTYEGGIRVPAIAHWPSRIKPGYTMELSSALDLLPTIAHFTGSQLPPVTLDGVDMAPFLFHEEKSLRETFFYYSPAPGEKQISFAIRYKQYKAHFYTKGASLSGMGHPDPDCRKTAKRTKHVPPLLYDLHRDPAEQYNIAHEPEYQDIIKEMTRIREEFDSRMFWAESEIRKPSYQDLMPCCNPGCVPQPYCCHCTTSSSIAYNPWDLYTSIWEERDRDREGKKKRKDGIRDKSEYYTRDGRRRDKDRFLKEPKRGKGGDGDIFSSNNVRGNGRDDALGRERTRDGSRGEKNRGVLDTGERNPGREGRIPMRGLDKPRDRSEKDRGIPREPKERIKVSPRGRIRIQTDEGVMERERGRDRIRGTASPFGNEEGQETRRGRKNGRDGSRGRGRNSVLDENGNVVHGKKRRVELKDMYIDLTSLGNFEGVTETYLDDLMTEGQFVDDEDLGALVSVGSGSHISEDEQSSYESQVIDRSQLVDGSHSNVGSQSTGSNPSRNPSASPSDNPSSNPVLINEAIPAIIPPTNPESGGAVGTNVRDYFGGFSAWHTHSNPQIQTQSDSVSGSRNTAISTTQSNIQDDFETTTQDLNINAEKTNRRNLKSLEKRLQRQSKKELRKGVRDGQNYDRNIQI